MRMSPGDPEAAPDGDSAAASAWTREQAGRLARDPATVAPAFDHPDEDYCEDVHLWDTWFLRRRDGSVASVEGWRVAFSLTADADLLPGKRHDVATVRYSYSRDGTTWHLGEPVFDGGALGSRQWAGSALYDDGEVYLFYTPAGEAGEADLSYTQSLAVARGGTLAADEDGVDLSGPWEHEELLRPDGEHYETQAQSRGMIYTFRDPWFYEDPAGGTYLLFEANTPVPEGSDACGGDPALQEFNGAVGVARSPTGDPTDWELEAPLLTSVCVNQELERPHVVNVDGRYYLFVSSHVHTFAPGLAGYDGLYGFVADSLHGDYRPLNGSGLVATNPADAPFQSYSWVALERDGELLATAFLNYLDYDRPSLDDVADLPEDEQRARFGGTLAPTLRVALDGDRTHVVAALDHGYVPTPAEDLPPVSAGNRRLRGADLDDVPARERVPPGNERAAGGYHRPADYASRGDREE